MMGQLFEVSGAAKRMALSFLKLFGKGREEIGHGHHGLPRLDPDLLQFRLHHPDAAGQGNLLLIRDSGVGAVIAEAMVETSLPAILLPFLIATIIRFIQGSGTVAMITAASITAPIIANMSVNPVFAALVACVGSLFYSYFNDSFFWVVNRSIGITEGREQLRLYSVASTIAWAIGIVVLLILNALFG